MGTTPGYSGGNALAAEVRGEGDLRRSILANQGDAATDALALPNQAEFEAIQNEGQAAAARRAAATIEAERSAVRLLSEQRAAAGHFIVSMIFWEEVVDGLQLNPQMLRNFYPQLVLPTGGAPDRGRLLAATELGFCGPFVWAYIQLIYGEFGWMARETSTRSK